MASDDLIALYHKTVKFDPDMPEELRNVGEQVMFDLMGTDRGAQALRSVSKLCGEVTIKYDPEEKGTCFERFRPYSSQGETSNPLLRLAYRPSNTLILGKDIRGTFCNTSGDAAPMTFERFLIHEFVGHAASDWQKNNDQRYFDSMFSFKGCKEVMDKAVGREGVPETLKEAALELSKNDSPQAYRTAFEAFPKDVQRGLVDFYLKESETINSLRMAQKMVNTEPSAIEATNPIMVELYGEECRINHDAEFRNSEGKPYTYQTGCDDNGCIGDENSLFKVLEIDTEAVKSPAACASVDPFG